MTDREARAMFLACLCETGGPSPMEIRQQVKNYLAHSKLQGKPKLWAVPNPSSLPPTPSELEVRIPKSVFLTALRAGLLVFNGDSYRLSHVATVFLERVDP